MTTAARFLLACLFAAFVAAACGATPVPSVIPSAPVSPSSSSAPTPIRSGAPAALAGTAWKAILVAGQPTVAGSEPTAVFAANQVQGTSGCNSYSGSYQYANGTIKLGNLISTAVGCGGAVGFVEQRFDAALRAASSVTIDPAGRLVLDGPGGSIAFLGVHTSS